VLDWDDGGEVVLELEEADGGTRVRVRETSPDFATALAWRLEAPAAEPPTPGREHPAACGGGGRALAWTAAAA
jgi:hypothetical protein